MAKDRIKQKENKTRFFSEEDPLDKGKDLFGICDPTPREAVARIIRSYKHARISEVSK